LFVFLFVLLEMLPRLVHADHLLINQQGTKLVLQVTDPRWTVWFDRQYGANERPNTASAKWMPWFVLQALNKTQLRLLLEGLRRADGSWAQNRPVIYTSSESFRDELLAVCMLAGYTAYFVLDQLAGEVGRVITGAGNIPGNTVDAWTVIYNEPTHHQGSGKSWPVVSGADIESEHYLGKVWCVEVDHPDHLIIAQRAHRAKSGAVTKAGRPIVVGNCEPVLGAIYGGRGKMAWELFLPTSATDPNAQQVHLLGRDDQRTFREFIVHRQRGVAQIYSLLEHGRRVFRSLEYTSDTRFTHRYVEPDIRDRAQEWHPAVRHAAGKLLPAFWDASLVITRDRTDAFGKVTEETFLPSRFLYGLLPSALLDNFFFWQRSEEDGFVGFPRDRTQPNWFYRVEVRLVQLPDGNTGKVQYSAVVTRHKLDPETIDRDDPRASDTDGASSFEMKKQLDPADPLLVAINQSKVATLKEMGYSDTVASGVLKRFDYDLAIAQSWLADPTNAAEIAALKSADPATAAAINEARSSNSFNIADGAGSKHQLLLLNLLHAAPGSTLYRLATVLSRIEDLSNILCWSASSVTAVGDEVSISLIECPRLKLRLQPRVYLNERNEESIRLYSLDHSNMYVSDTRSDLLNKLLDGLDGTILLENNEHELFVLAPNCIAHRPLITSSPFSAELVFERGAGAWMAAQESRFYLYPVHGSHTFMFTPTQASAVYLILLRLLGRQYTEAYSVVQSCEADRKLTGSEEWILQQLANAATDFHPNAAAIRLKLSLVILHSQAPWPWRVQDEYRLYLEKLNNVSAICRLSVDEELYLLKHLRSGAEMEDLNEAEGNDENELDNAPRHLDVALANRLNFLTGMISEEEEYEQEAASLRFDSKHESVPLLTRTRSGRKQVYLEKPVQRGCKNLWSEVENAVDRYYADFSFNSRTWDAVTEVSERRRI
jgi:hypothetical protein